MPPSTPEQCLERAVAYERRATVTASKDVREVMLLLAHRWRALAHQDDLAAQQASDAAKAPPIMQAFAFTITDLLTQEALREMIDELEARALALEPDGGDLP